MRTMTALVLVCITAAFAAPAWAGSSCCGARPLASSEPAVTAPAAEKAAKPQTTCPVMGEPINKEQYVDYKGRRVYFCCSACKEKFNANPEEYVKKLIAEGVDVELAPAPEQK
jgi:YHS domain-containing protein